MNPATVSDSISRPIKVAIVGAGNVGASFAYTLLLSGLAAEIVLIDANRAKAEGEAMDLSHAIPFAPPTRVWAGDYSDANGAIVTVVTAGANQKPGETRLDLAKKNAAIFEDIIPSVVAANRDGLLLIATNPVDVLTYRALKSSGLPTNRVLGSGTILDTARFRFEIGRHFEIDPHSVQAHIIGEHGDSEVPAWSLATIAGMRLPDYGRAHGLSLSSEQKDDIFARTRDAAYQIINRKGATYYAIASGLLEIVQAIVRDQNTVLPVSSLISDYDGIDDVCMGLPTIVNRSGIARVLHLELDETERAALQHSSDVLKATLKHISE